MCLRVPIDSTDPPMRAVPMRPNERRDWWESPLLLLCWDPLPNQTLILAVLWDSKPSFIAT